MTALTVSPRRARTRRRLWWAFGIAAVLLLGLLGAAIDHGNAEFLLVLHAI